LPEIYEGTRQTLSFPIIPSCSDEEVAKERDGIVKKFDRCPKAT
jgi:hypothetical protein